MPSPGERNLPKEDAALVEALRLIVKKCPRLASACYWAGTSCISIEVLHHRRSFDLDFHTREALCDVRPFATEMAQAFGAGFELTAAPDEHGSAFRGIITLPDGERLAVEVLSNYRDVPVSSLTEATSAPGLRRITLERCIEDKVQCLVERLQSWTDAALAADLASYGDIDPRLAAGARERLLRWLRGEESG